MSLVHSHRRSLTRLLAFVVAIVIAGEFVAPPRIALADDASQLAPIAPFVHDRTAAVGVVDLDKFDPAALRGVVESVMTSRGEDAGARTRVFDQWSAMRTLLREAGAGRLYAVFTLEDLPQFGPLVVLPADTLDEANQIAEAWRKLTNEQQTVSVIEGCAVAGDLRVIQSIASRKPADRADLESALRAVGNASVQLAVGVTADNRRTLRELPPKLPEEIGGATLDELADVGWAAIGLDAAPQPRLDLLIQLADTKAATALRDELAAVFNKVGQMPAVKQALPHGEKLLTQLLPSAENDRLAMRLGDQPGEIPGLLALMSLPVGEALDRAVHQRSFSNLKQLALAAHNYYDIHKHLPANASFDDAGRPLLSWRVHLLPLLDQKPLYDQFHLNEPWDSEHNRKLIEKMPDLFKNPGMELEAGITAYLALTGPKTVFRDKEGMKFQTIIDGTSNTILFVEATADRAVAWTKPDDLPFDMTKPRAGLFSDARRYFRAVFCDGATHLEPSSISDERLIRLAIPDDGQFVPEK